MKLADVERFLREIRDRLDVERAEITRFHNERNFEDRPDLLGNLCLKLYNSTGTHQKIVFNEEDLDVPLVELVADVVRRYRDAMGK